MLDRRRLLNAAALTGAAMALPPAAWARTPDEAGPAGDLNALGPEARMIAARTGLWDVVETVWSAPGAAGVATTGLVAERRMMGGLLQEILRPPADTGLADVKRTDLLSLHRLEGRWRYVSFDTRAPVGLMHAWSETRGDPTIDLTFAPFAVPAPGPAAVGQLLRMRQVIRFDGPDRDVKSQFFTLADGTGTTWLGHRYAYTRRLG